MTSKMLSLLLAVGSSLIAMNNDHSELINVLKTPQEKMAALRTLSYLQVQKSVDLTRSDFTMLCVSITMALVQQEGMFERALDAALYDQKRDEQCQQMVPLPTQLPDFSKSEQPGVQAPISPNYMSYEPRAQTPTYSDNESHSFGRGPATEPATESDPK